MAHATNRSGSAPWDDWDENRHGRPDDVPQGSLGDLASSQKDAEDFGVASSRLQNAGEAASEANESVDDTAEGQSRALARHSIDDEDRIVSNDQDGLSQDAPVWPAMHSDHAPRHGEDHRSNAAEAEHRLDDRRPSGLPDREAPGGGAHEARDGPTESHQGDATESQDLCDNSQQVLNGEADWDEHEGPDHEDDHTSDRGRGRGEHNARDGAGDDQQDDAHDANGEDVQAPSEHHDEHDNPGEGSHHCGEKPGNEGLRGQDDGAIASDGSAHEARVSGDEDHQVNAIESQDLCDNNQQVLDDDADNHEGPHHEEDHTSDRGRGEHDARDGAGDDQQDDVHEINGDDGHEVQQTANEQQDEHNTEREGSHHFRDKSGEEGSHGQDDVAAFLSSDTLAWKETSEWCASAMGGATSDSHDLQDMSSLFEGCHDEGVIHCQALGHGDAPDITHATAFAAGQPDHGLLIL
jgi:hypothetical protein